MDLCGLTGKILGADKHERMAASVIFTGCVLLLGRGFPDSSIVLAPKPGRLEKLAAIIEEPTSSQM